MGIVEQIAHLTKSVATGERAAALRTVAIVEAVRLGTPTAEIAAAAGVSGRRVRFIAGRAGLGRPTRGRPPKPKNGDGG